MCTKNKSTQSKHCKDVRTIIGILDGNMVLTSTAYELNVVLKGKHSTIALTILNIWKKTWMETK
jgi:hypothetical protein